MGRNPTPTIYDAAGKPITLNQMEQQNVRHVERQLRHRFNNAVGYEVNVTTLTQIIKKVSTQKYFEIPFAEYLPVRVGEGAWASNLLTYRSFDVAGEFETGIINLGKDNSRLASADAGVDAVPVTVNNWAKAIGWTIFELNQATRSGNWDIVEAKEKSRKRNWDLGIQRVAFLGARGLNGNSGSALGLLNQTGITTNTSLITKPIKTMSPTELSTLLQNLIEVYRANTNRTAYPNRFLIPESDYNGLAAQASPTFPMKTILQLMEESLAIVTRKPDFKILPLPYLDASYSGYGYQLYALYNSDEEAIRMDIPVDYTSTIANSIDNFSFQNAAYGQFTGAQAYRPLEMMYFRY